MGISSKMPSQRQLRVGENLRHIIAEAIQRLSFYSDALQNTASLTVTEVRVSPDLKNATAYVIALGGQSMEGIIPALNDVAPMFQKEISRHSKMKFTPRVQFKIDDSFDNASRIESLLRDLKLPEDGS
jgi:ribosome-binding factor A